MVQFRQHITCKHVAFVDVRVTRQNERFDADGAIGFDFGEHLVRVANDRSAAA